MRLSMRGEIEQSWSGSGAVGWEATIDGAGFVAERGRGGDYRFRHGEGSLCHLSSDGAVLLCALGNEQDPLSWRVVLDSVLFSVALIRGYEALHAGAVGTAAGALAIAAGSGGGKSTLLAELLAGDCSLLADDIVVLKSRDSAAPLAHPGAPLMTVPAGIDSAPGIAIGSAGAETWVAVPTAPEAMPLIGAGGAESRPRPDDRPAPGRGAAAGADGVAAAVPAIGRARASSLRARRRDRRRGSGLGAAGRPEGDSGRFGRPRAG